MLNTLIDSMKNKKTNYWEDRILSQLKYACKLSTVNHGAFDELIEQVEQYVIDSFEKDNHILQGTVLEAEKLLQTLSQKAKSFKMICAAHAHIDMNWMCRWDETVSFTLDTFRTMLDIMKEYPEYKFSQSQASVYKIVEDYDPEMLEEIKMRVKEGRWEITASTWVEADKNLPNGESLSRQILYTKKYLSKLFNINPDSLNIDFEPDTFGHSLNIPEILDKGGVKYYYHCRGYEEHHIYKWIVPSGSSIIVYREPDWYNSSIESSMTTNVPEFCTKYDIDTMLKVYGVRDHGGGPTRRDLERIIDMNTWPIFPEIRFGTYGEFFSKLEKVKESLPEVNGELNFIFDGCYTTQTRIKLGNRVCEAMMNESEMFNSIAAINVELKYPAADFEKGWKDILFNQFHDIIPGSGTVDTREHAMGIYQNVMAIANSKRDIAFRKIAAKIDTLSLIPENENIKESTSEGAGVGFEVNNYKISQCSRGSGKTRIFHLFNPSVNERKDVTEFIIWDWIGDIERLVFMDETGQTVKHQVVDKGFNEFWGHRYLKVLVSTTVPPCGYTTYTMMENDLIKIMTPAPLDPRTQKEDRVILENNFIKVVFNPLDASISSMIDKVTGEELIDDHRKSGIFRLIDEDDQKGMTAWIIGRYMNIENLDKNIKISKLEYANCILRSAINYDVEFKGSKLKVNVWMDQESALLNYDVTCEWLEIGVKGKSIPQLNFYMPVNYKCSA